MKCSGRGEKFGAYAEFARVSEDGIVARKPADMTLEEAATVLGGRTSASKTFSAPMCWRAYPVTSPSEVLDAARHKKGRPPPLLCSLGVTAYVDCDC